MHQSNHTPEQRGVFQGLSTNNTWVDVPESVYNKLPDDMRRIAPQPQEGEAERKAKELIDKFNMALPNSTFPCYKNETAKQCALICVDEILKAINGDGISWDINSYFLNGKHVSCKDYKQFWQQVRHNIVNL